MTIRNFWVKNIGLQLKFKGTQRKKLGYQVTTVRLKNHIKIFVSCPLEFRIDYLK